MMDGIGGRQLRPLGWALILQLILLAVTVWIIVVEPKKESDPAFVAGKHVSLHPRELAHRAALAEHQAAASPAISPERIKTAQLLPKSLPVLPRLPTNTFSPFELKEPAANPQALLAVSHMADGFAGASSERSEVNLFGIRENAERIVILVDTSNSMFERQKEGVIHQFDFGYIKEEVGQLINGLNANTLFNLAIYEGGSMAWKEHLLPATKANKTAARAWFDGLSESPGATISSRPHDGPKLLEGGGSRLDTGFRQVFAFNPEVVFVITDGEINRRPGGRITEKAILKLLKELQSGLDEPARIHVILYETALASDVEVSTLRALARNQRGSFKRIEAASY